MGHAESDPRNADRACSQKRPRDQQQKASTEHPVKSRERPEPNGNGEAPVQETGAQFTLKRLEREEAQAFARLQGALAAGNQLEIEQCQLFWVRCVESLRKLDLSIEVARRDAEMQIPLKTAESAVLLLRRMDENRGHHIFKLRNQFTNGHPRPW